MSEAGDHAPHPSAWLRRIALRSFRNYESLDIPLDAGLTLIVGSNGHGKTNLIESVYVLCLGRSFREHRDERLIRFGDPMAVVMGEAEWGGGVHEMQVEVSRSGPKRATIDGAPLERLSELIGQLPVVSLTPEDHAIAFGDPAARRRFMDVLLAQTDREYLAALRGYRRSLNQRNAALRARRAELAALYEAPLAEAGELLRKSRGALASYLSENAGEIYRTIGPQREHLFVEYRPNPAELVEGGLAGALAQGRGGDLERGHTARGPHRDDLNLSLGRRPLKPFGSHGQARTALAAIKLAEVRYYEEAYDRSPVLVMDEVATVLDTARAASLLDLVAGGASQVLVTSPRREDLGGDAERQAHVVEIREGRAV